VSIIGAAKNTPSLFFSRNRTVEDALRVQLYIHIYQKKRKEKKRKEKKRKG
jgi:hypothetical protein